jgi:hypothetical protein
MELDVASLLHGENLESVCSRRSSDIYQEKVVLWATLLSQDQSMGL